MKYIVLPVIFFLYTLAMLLAIVLLFPIYWLRAQITGKDKHGLWQRVGCVPKKIFHATEYVWFHAVSAGEVKAAVPVISSFIGKNPVAVSVGTETGYKMVREHFGDAVDVFYLPMDFFGTLGRLFHIIQPKALVIVETEIWPALIALAYKRKVPVLMINGRMPPKVYKSYHSMRWFWKYIFPMYTGLLVQSEYEAEMFRACGAPKEIIKVYGNTKYDVYAQKKEDDRKERIAKLFANRPMGKKVVIIGSTHRGEEDSIFEALESLYVHAYFILAPRHIERCDEITKILDTYDLTYEKRSSGKLSWDCDVVLWDTMGELDVLYAFGDIVCVGGSWIPQGGHNIIEPAVWAKPIVVGPYMHNFQEIFDVFSRHDAIVQAPAESLLEHMSELITDDSRRAVLAKNARACVDMNAGSTAHYVDAITAAIAPRVKTRKKA